MAKNGAAVAGNGLEMAGWSRDAAARTSHHHEWGAKAPHTPHLRLRPGGYAPPDPTHWRIRAKVKCIWCIGIIHNGPSIINKDSTDFEGDSIDFVGFHKLRRDPEDFARIL